MMEVSTLSPEWVVWVAECRTARVPDEEILQILRQNGVSEQTALASLARETANCSAAVCASSPALAKLESMLDVLRATRSTSRRELTVTRVRDITDYAFLDEHYASNRPLILSGFLSGCPASSWTVDELAVRFGNLSVEVMGEREADSEYELNSEAHRRTMDFVDYVSYIRTVGESNDIYMVANNGFLSQPGAQELCAELEPLPSILERDLFLGRAFLWLGPRGTITPLHHDTMNVMLAQIAGRKRITLIPPTQTHLMYNHVGVYSKVDIEQWDATAFPRFAEATPLVTDLMAGEALFIPVGWWHHVRSLDESLSVSFTNFIWPNDFEHLWRHP